MKKNFILLFVLMSTGCFSLFSQSTAKKVMDPSVYEEWKDIQGVTISADGKWVAYTLKPGKGDPQLALYEVATDETRWYPRSDKASFSYEGRVLTFTIHPAEDSVKSYKKREVPKEDREGDSLGIVFLEDQELRKVPHLKSSKFPDKWEGCLAYQSGKEKGDAHPLYIHRLASDEVDTLAEVSSYEFAEEGNYLVAITEEKDSVQAAGVHLFDCENGNWMTIWEGEGEYTHLRMSREGKQTAFLLDRDTTKALVRPFELLYWKNGWDQARVIFDDTFEQLPEGYLLSPDMPPSFSEDGNRLFFGTRYQPVVKILIC